jgi:hypothetical protein
MANQAPFVIQPRLTGIAMTYRNAKAIADQVLRRIPVQSPVFRLVKWTREDAFNIPTTFVGRKGKPTQVDFSATSVESSVQDYALDDPVPNSDIQAGAVSGVDPLARAVEGVTDLLALDREKRVADLVFTAANYPAANKITLAGNDMFSFYGDASNEASNPLLVIDTARDSMLIKPNKGVMGRAVESILRRHPRIVKAYHGTLGSDGKVPLQYLADLFELDELLVGEGWYNSANKGQAASLTRVWGKKLLLFYDNLAVNDVQASQVTFGFTGEWGNRLAGTITDSDIGMRGGERVRVGESVKELISASDAGYLITGAVA